MPWLLLLALAQTPLAAREVSVFKRALGEQGPQLAIDDDPATVWRGKPKERASFWFHQNELSRLRITGCDAPGRVRVRGALWRQGAFGDPPWTEVELAPGVATEVALKARFIDMVQLELITASCVALLEVEGKPTPAKPSPDSFTSDARLAAIGNQGGTCSWFESEPELRFTGTCSFQDATWMLKGNVQRPDGRCWMHGMPIDRSGPECPSASFKVTWPVRSVNKCMVLVDGRSFGRVGCW